MFRNKELFVQRGMIMHQSDIERFAPDTRYMVEFLVLKQTEKFEEAGIYHRYFLTKKAYYEMIELQSQGILRFQRQALVLEGTLHYLPVQTFFRDQE